MSNQLFSLQGKVALITGGSGDIGAAIAHTFARAGARLALHGTTQSKLEGVRATLESFGTNVTTIRSFINTAAQCQQVVDDTVREFGQVNILVNCAGMNRRKPILDVTEDDYDAIMTVHARGSYFMSQAVAPHMIAQGGGKIIHIGSATIRTGLADVSVYGMAKAGLDALTRAQAVEWAEHNIQVNCLAPGFILTELTRKGVWENERRRQWWMDRIPMKRAGLPEEMAGVALLFASGASSFLTGQTLHVDGGFAAGSKW